MFQSIFKCQLTSNDERVDGHPVRLVVLVRVGAPQSQAGAKRTEEVCQETNNHKGSNATDVACAKKKRVIKFYQKIPKDLQKVIKKAEINCEYHFDLLKISKL